MTNNDINNNDLTHLSLIGTKELAMQPFFNYNDETARRYFRKNIFRVHSIDGSAQMTYKGSAEARYEALNRAKIEAKKARRGFYLKDIGTILNRVSDENSQSENGDGYVVWRLKNNEPFEEVKKDFITLVLKEIV